MALEGIGDLRAEEDIAFERRWWTVERVAWLVLALVLIAGLLGLCGGGGPLNQQTKIADGGALKLSYARFARHQAPATLTVTVETPAGSAGRLELWVSRSFLEGVELDDIVPEPESSRVLADRTEYTFQVSDRAGPPTVLFQYRPAGYGGLDGQVGGVGQQSLRFSQFVYP